MCWDRVLRGCVTSICAFTCAFSYPVIPNCVLGAVLFVCVGIEFYEAASLVYLLLCVLFHIQSFQTCFGGVLFVSVGIEFYEAVSLVYVLLYVLFHIQSFQTVF